MSSIDDFTTGNFQEVLHDPEPPKQAARILVCTGKVYYELAEYRRKHEVTDVEIVRLEQLYPLPLEELQKVFARHPGARLFWCQEEPRNMGAWSFVEPNIEWVLTKVGVPNARPRYTGRAATASTATGLASRHGAELASFLDDALAG